MTAPEHIKTFCTCENCPTDYECARHVMHYEVFPDKAKFENLENLIQECEHYEELEP
jgi:hypothetical protein